MVEIRAESQQRVGDRYHLEGDVELLYGDVRLTADQADYDSATGEVVAQGNIHYSGQQQNEDIRASRAEYNLRRRTGRFYDVEGSVGGIVNTGGSLLTTTNPFYFTAERIERVEENTYRVYNAVVTVCTPPKPTWTFAAPMATIRTGASVGIRGATLRVLGVPVFYLPYVYRSLRRIPRNSGFLMPSIGNNSRFGIVIGDSFFWAINRSMDAEIGGEYLSDRGWSQTANFRMRPTHSSYLNVRYYGVVDRGFGPDKVDQGGRTAGAEGVSSFPHGLRGVLDYNYLSSVTFREAFAQSYTEAVNSEVHSSGFLTKNTGSLGFNVLLSQIENFQSREPGDTVRLRALPSVELNGVDRPLWQHSPFLISWESSAGWVSRGEPALIDTGLSTAFLERLQFYPKVTLPLHWKGFHLAPSVGFKADHYGKSLATSVPGDQRRLTSNDWQRTATTVAVDLIPPALSKLYSGAGVLARQPFRHVIEPRVTFRNVNDSGDVRRALWFDSRDLLADTTELEYSLTNRIFTKALGSGSREVLTWELRQQYYFDPNFEGALREGRRNVLPSSLYLTGHAFLDGPRRFSPVVSLLRFRPSGQYDLELRYDYDPVRHRFVQGGLTGGLRWREAFLSMNHSFVRSSPALAAPSNQLGFSTGYGNSLRQGWNAVFAGAYDVRAGHFQFTAFQGSYNNDCCGVSFEYRRFALGPSRNENQFRVAFSLANIGTFGTLKKQERLF